MVLIHYRENFQVKRIPLNGSPIQAMLTSIGVNLEKLKFVRGTEFQLSKEKP